MADCNIDYGVLRDSLGYRIRLAEVASMQTFGQAFEGTGLTAARFTALELVHRNPGIGPARLAAAMAVCSLGLALLIPRHPEKGNETVFARLRPAAAPAE